MTNKPEISELLEIGKEFLKLKLGIVSRIQDQIYTVKYCSKNLLGIRPGDNFELCQTYCSEVIMAGGTRYFDDVAAISEMLKHPCYLNTQLRAYIGTPIRIDNHIWGTLNYSALIPRSQQYSSEEIGFLEQQAQVISRLIRQQH